MANLTKAQKGDIEMIVIFYKQASLELHKNGRTDEYDRQMWMYVYHCDRLGLDVAPHERRAADRHWQARVAAA